MATTVSAPITMAGGAVGKKPADFRAFASARRRTCSSGDSPGRMVSSTSAGTTSKAKPALRKHSWRRGEEEASTRRIVRDYKLRSIGIHPDIHVGLKPDTPKTWPATSPADGAASDPSAKQWVSFRKADFTAKSPPTSEEEPHGAGIVSESAPSPRRYARNRVGSWQPAHTGWLSGPIVGMRVHPELRRLAPV